MISNNTNTADKPLVTIAVIVYNSSATILEALESAKAQTYGNVELVISDDASTDDTAKICQKWVAENGARFTRAEILIAAENRGIPANHNRTIRAAHGKYVKSLAGDDILLPNCVENFVEFMESHADAQIAFSRIQEFCGNVTERKFFQEYPDKKNQVYFEKSAEEQFLAFVKGDFWVPAPGLFFKTELLNKFPYDEHYPTMEDLPEWCKLTKLGIHFAFLNKRTLLFRVKSGSASAFKDGYFYPARFMESRKLFFIHELRKYLSDIGETKQIRKYEREFLTFDFVMFLFKNKKNPWASFWKHIFSRILKICQ